MSTSPTVFPQQDDRMSHEASSAQDGVSPSRSGTALLRALVAETARRPEGVRRRALSATRKARLLAGDPAVRVVVDGSELVMPLSHDLPIHRARHPEYSRNLGTVAAALHETRPGAPIVDVGANVGDSVAIIRAQVPNASILCIEGDVQFLPYLHHNVRGLTGVEVAPVYVRHSVESDAGTMTVVRVGGTASLVEQAGEGSVDAVTTRSLAAILADHPDFEHPGLLKLDTDGHDADILLLAESMLAEARPVVFFEFDPSMASDVGGADPHRALAMLARRGYRRALMFTNTGDLAGVLEVDAWESGVPIMSAEIGPGWPVAYFDVCVFSPAHLDVADEVVRRERARP